MALVDAASAGDEGSVQRLLDGGATARCDAPGLGDAFGWGYSALTMAILVKEPDRRLRIATLLLERGADPNGPGAYGGTVLGLAMEAGDDSLVRAIRTAGGRLPSNAESLNAAAGAGNLDEVKALIESGVGVDAGAGYKRSVTPLIAAARGGRSEVIRFLLSRGAKLDAEDDAAGLTALGHAMTNGHSKAVAILRAAGALRLGSGWSR